MLNPGPKEESWKQLWVVCVWKGFQVKFHQSAGRTQESLQTKGKEEQPKPEEGKGSPTLELNQNGAEGAGSATVRVSRQAKAGKGGKAG